MRGIPADDVDLDQLRPWLLHFEARSHGTTTAKALEWAILGRDRQLWVCGDWQAVVLTSVHPDAVRIDFCAGRRREDWQDTVDEVIGAWAQSLGKTYVISLARPGWAKYARERGYREIHREFARRI